MSVIAVLDSYWQTHRLRRLFLVLGQRGSGYRDRKWCCTASTVIPTITWSAAELATLNKAVPDKRLNTKGTSVNALAMDAITAAVPASAGVIFALALRFAAAAVALALLATALMPVAAIKPMLPNTLSASVPMTWIAINKVP